MESAISASDQQDLVTSFLEIAAGQTADTARQFLQVRFTRNLTITIRNGTALISFDCFCDFCSFGNG